MRGFERLRGWEVLISGMRKKGKKLDPFNLSTSHLSTFSLERFWEVLRVWVVARFWFKEDRKYFFLIWEGGRKGGRGDNVFVRFLMSQLNLSNRSKVHPKFVQVRKCPEKCPNSRSGLRGNVFVLLSEKFWEVEWLRGTGFRKEKISFLSNERFWEVEWLRGTSFRKEKISFFFKWEVLRGCVVERYWFQGWEKKGKN